MTFIKYVSKVILAPRRLFFYYKRTLTLKKNSTIFQITQKLYKLFSNPRINILLSAYEIQISTEIDIVMN